MKWFVCSFSYYIFNIHSLPLPYSFIVYMVLREVIAWFTTLHYRYNLLLDCWQVPTLRRPNFEMLARYLDRMCNDGFVSWGYNAYINFSDIGNDFYSDVLCLYMQNFIFVQLLHHVLYYQDMHWSAATSFAGSLWERSWKTNDFQ